jgi:hypothetical protein
MEFFFGFFLIIFFLYSSYKSYFWQMPLFKPNMHTCQFIDLICFFFFLYQMALMYSAFAQYEQILYSYKNSHNFIYPIQYISIAKYFVIPLNPFVICLKCQNWVIKKNITLKKIHCLQTCMVSSCNLFSIFYFHVSSICTVFVVQAYLLG